MYHEGWWGPFYIRLIYLIPGTAFLILTLVGIKWPHLVAIHPDEDGERRVHFHGMWDTLIYHILFGYQFCEWKIDHRSRFGRFHG